MLRADKVTLTYLADPNWVKAPEKELAKKFEEKTGIAIAFQLVPSDQFFNWRRRNHRGRATGPTAADWGQGEAAF